MQGSVLGPYFQYTCAEINNTDVVVGSMLFVFSDFFQPQPPTAVSFGNSVYLDRLKLRIWSRLYLKNPVDNQGLDFYRISIFRINRAQNDAADGWVHDPSNFFYIYDPDLSPPHYVQHGSQFLNPIREDTPSLFTTVYDRVFKHEFMTRSITSINVASGGETVPDSQNPQFSSTTWANNLNSGVLELPTFVRNDAYEIIDIPIQEECRLAPAPFPFFHVVYVTAGESPYYPKHTPTDPISLVTCQSTLSYYVRQSSV